MADRPLHVVFGAGNVGRALVVQLSELGLTVRVVTRTQPSGLPKGVQWRGADAADATAATEAARGAAVIYQCLNAPYAKWTTRFPPLQRGVLAAAEGTRMHAYISLCLATGMRTEEARALRWEHVDFGDPAARPAAPASAAVWRSVRAHGDTKTEKSRRTLSLPQMAVDALMAHKVRQAEERLTAGSQWSDNDLVFSARTGGALDAANVRREFRAVCKAAKIGQNWTPRELRHSFVSLMSSSGVPVEEIARLAGHSNTRTTEVVYRRELRPVLTTGAEAMDRLFPSSSAPVRGTRKQHTKSGHRASLAAR